VLVLLGTGFAYLRVKLEGPDLGDKLASLLNKRMRGRIAIESVEWPTSALETVATGGWVPITIRGVKVWDDCALSAGIGETDPDELRVGDPNEDCTPDDRPDADPASRRKPRKLLLRSDLITAELDIHAALFGNHDLVFRHVVVHGGDALLEQTREPYPLHAYDRTIVSIVTAFYPRLKAGFHAGIFAQAPPPIFDLRDMHVEHLNLTAHLAPYTVKDGVIGYGLTARIEDVNVDPEQKTDDSYLHMNPTDPLVAKFYVRLALHGGHTNIRILDEGPRAAFHLPGTGGLGDDFGKGRKAEYELQLSEITLDRLAQLPTEWAKRDYVANTLSVALSAHTIPCGAGQRVEDGADLRLTGELLDWWDRPYDGSWNLDLAVKNLGPTLRTCIKSTMGGDNLGGTISLRGPFIALPRVELNLHDLDVDVPLSAKEEPVRLTLAEVHGGIDLVNDEGYIEKTKALIQGGKEPGEVMVSATFGLRPLNATADLDIVNPIDVARFLPVKVATSAGHFLSGKLSVKGDVEEGFAMSDFDLSLGTSPKDRSVTVSKGRIFAKNDFEWIDFQKVHFDAGRNHAVINGPIEWVKDQFVYRNVEISGEFPDLGVWLQRFGLPAIAQSATGAGGGGSIILNGPVTNPTINARTTLAGVPCLDKVRIEESTFHDGILDVRFSSGGLGGSLKGTARVDVSGDVSVIEKLVVDGQNIEAGKLCGIEGLAKGTLDTLHIEMGRTPIVKTRPAVAWVPFVKAHISAPKLTVGTETYSGVSLCVNHANDDKLCRPWAGRLDSDDLASCEDAKKRGGFCIVAAATRDLGGKLAATIADIPRSTAPRHPFDEHLDGTIAVDDVPIAALGVPDAGGMLSATLHLSGKLTSPQAEGQIDLLRAWAFGAFIGDVHPIVTPVVIGKHPGIQITGDALAGQLGVSATIGTEGPYPVDIAISGRRVELDQFVDLAKKLGVAEAVQAWASGTVSVHTDLGNPKAQPEAWVEITELASIVNHRTRDGRLTPLRFELVPPAQGRYAMSLHVTPDTVELSCRDPSKPNGREACPAQLDTPAGRVSIEGQASAAGMALSARGSLALRRLAPLLENQVESIDGALHLTGRIGGTFAKPTYEIALDVADGVALRLPGGDSVLQVAPEGQIKLANGAVGLNGITFSVKDERRDEKGALHVAGTIGLDGLTPARWGVLVDGEITGKMLQAVAPGIVSQASGLADIDGALMLSGTGPLPLVRGTISFDPVREQGRTTSPIAFIPRGLRRELSFSKGSIDIDTSSDGLHRTYTINADEEPLEATIDGEGKLEHVMLDARFRDGTPEYAHVSLDADAIPFRLPGVLDLVLAAKDVDLTLSQDTHTWRARGNVAIVSGEYKRDFELTEALRPQPPKAAPAKPWWDEYPSLGNAELDLNLEVRRFAVNDNLTRPDGIELEGPRILISGSPRDPRLSGTIRVQSGTFSLPGTRAKFTKTRGTIDFASNEPAANPSLNIISEATDYLDLSGQQHSITLTISGSLEKPTWDLRTNTGLDRSQTIALIFLGRNPEQLRRSLGDQSLGSAPTIQQTSTNPSTGFADQIVKDVAGDWVSSLIGSKLTDLTGLDVLRFELGFGSVLAHAEVKAAENVRVIGIGEQTIRGNSIDARVEVKTNFHINRIVTDDRLSLQGRWLIKNYYDPAEQDISDYGGSVVYRLFIP
jgi:translocation and assembly module TamB